MAWELMEWTRAARHALALEALLQPTLPTSSEVGDAAHDSERLDFDSLATQALKAIGSTATGDDRAASIEIARQLQPLIPFVDCHLEEGLAKLALVAKGDIFLIAAWITRQTLHWLGKTNVRANTLKMLINEAQELSSKQGTYPAMMRIAGRVRELSDAFGGDHEDLRGGGMLSNFAWLCEHWSELHVADDAAWAKSWWWSVVDVARMSANEHGARGADSEEWHRIIAERIRFQIRLVLEERSRKTAHLPERLECSPEALRVLLAVGGSPAMPDAAADLLFRVGELRRSGTGKLRSVCAAGTNAQGEKVYVVLCHESDLLVIKRADKAHAEYGLMMGWDESVLAASR